MGKLAEIKTKETKSSVEEFVSRIVNEQKQKDSLVLIELMRKLTKQEPKIWSTSIVGFGNVIVKSPNTGREVEWLKIGFAPRKANLSLYLTGNIKNYDPFLKKLGKHKTAVGCLYINRLEDVDMNVLEKMITAILKAKQ